jgi:uncharacterized protein YjbI with pentapeptide repeats
LGLCANPASQRLLFDRMTETPCGRPHRTAAPSISAPAPTAEVPDCDEGDVGDLWLKDARVLGLDLDRPEWIDLKLDDCDLSGLVATGFVIRRAEVLGTRIRGVTLAKGQIDDALIEGCTTNELSFRFTRLRHVVFRECDLSGVDFYNTTFDHVTIADCNLQRAQFDAADVKCLRITNCDLTGVTGTAGLKGATLDASDLPALAVSLAVEIGLAVRDA